MDKDADVVHALVWVGLNVHQVWPTLGRRRMDAAGFCAAESAKVDQCGKSTVAVHAACWGKPLWSNPMTDTTNHHLMCLGVMQQCYPQVDSGLRRAIEQGIAEAIELGVLPPDSIKRLLDGLPLVGEQQ